MSGPSGEFSIAVFGDFTIAAYILHRNEEMLMQLGDFIKNEMYGIMELSKLVHEQRDIIGVL